MRKKVEILGFCLLSLALAACSGNKDDKKDNEAPEAVEPVAVVTENEESVDVPDLGGDVSFNGVVVIPPAGHSTVTVTMGGALESISVFTGDYVKAGQTIATLRNPDFIKLQQEFLTSCAQAEFLEKEYRRQEMLASHEAASQKKLQQSRAEYLSEKSRMDAASAQLLLLDVDTASLRSGGIIPYMEIKAPISGYVTDMKANLGQYFNAGEPVCDIIDKTETMLRLTVYEKDLPLVTLGSAVSFKVSGLDVSPFEAEIVAIDQTVDSESRSINVYAAVKDNDDLFRQGMYVNAKLEGNM